MHEIKLQKGSFSTYVGGTREDLVFKRRQLQCHSLGREFRAFSLATSV